MGACLPSNPLLISVCVSRQALNSRKLPEYWSESSAICDSVGSGASVSAFFFSFFFLFFFFFNSDLV